MLLPFNAVKILRFFKILKLMKVHTSLLKRVPKFSEILQKNRVDLMLLWLLSAALIISFPLTFVEPQMPTYLDALWYSLINHF